MTRVYVLIAAKCKRFGLLRLTSLRWECPRVGRVVEGGPAQQQRGAGRVGSIRRPARQTAALLLCATGTPCQHPMPCRRLAPRPGFDVDQCSGFTWGRGVPCPSPALLSPRRSQHNARERNIKSTSSAFSSLLLQNTPAFFCRFVKWTLWGELLVECPSFRPHLTGWRSSHCLISNLSLPIVSLPGLRS